MICALYTNVIEVIHYNYNNNSIPFGDFLQRGHRLKNGHQSHNITNWSTLVINLLKSFGATKTDRPSERKSERASKRESERETNKALKEDIIAGMS